MSVANPMILALKPDYMIGNRSTKNAFTITELIVAVAIFSIVAIAAVGLLTTALRSQRKVIAVQNIQDNGRYLIGFIAKEVRMSEIRSSDGGITVLDITHPENGDITYVFSGTQILRNTEPINSDEVEVSGSFYVDGKLAGDNEQPRVTIIMKVSTTGVKIEEQAEINLQTTLTQRNLD